MAGNDFLVDENEELFDGEDKESVSEGASENIDIDANSLESGKDSGFNKEREDIGNEESEDVCETGDYEVTDEDSNEGESVNIDVGNEQQSAQENKGQEDENDEEKMSSEEQGVETEGLVDEEENSEDKLRDNQRSFEEKDNDDGEIGKGKCDKKKNLLYAFFAFLLVVILIFGYFVFFGRSVVGTWKIEKGQSNKGVAALVLDADGKATYTTGSYVVTGNWKKTGEVLTLSVKADGSDILSGDYDCRVSAGLTDKTVELWKGKDRTMTLRQYKLEEAVHPVSNFVPKKELLGKWSTDKSGYAYEFKDNGLAIFSKDNISVTYTYFFDDNYITLMIYHLKDSSDEESSARRVMYSVNNDTLSINSVKLKKVQA